MIISPLPKIMTQNEFYSLGNKIFVSVNGIFIEDNSILPDWLARSQIYIDINIKERKLHLNTSRDAFVRDENSYIIKDEIENKIINLIKEYISKVNIHYPLQSKIINNTFFQVYCSLHSLIISLDNNNKISSSILSFIREYYNF